MEILWPRASSQKQIIDSTQLLWDRVTIGWEDTRRGAPEA